MTIAILSKTPDQKIARPWSRACSMEELQDLMNHYARHAKMAVKSYGHVGTEEPILAVMERDGSQTVFYAFYEH